jgi:hypothetical protein
MAAVRHPAEDVGAGAVDLLAHDLRVLVISMINSSKGGAEKPCTKPDQTSARIGLKPRKFNAAATSVTAPVAA